MHNGVLEGECCRVIALLGFRTVLFAFSDRFCLLPRHIARNCDKLLDCSDGWMLVGFTGFQRIEDNIRSHTFSQVEGLSKTSSATSVVQPERITSNIAIEHRQVRYGEIPRCRF